VSRRLGVGSSNMKMIVFRARQRLLRGMQRCMGVTEELERLAGALDGA
jgi:hypothetical protein